MPIQMKLTAVSNSLTPDGSKHHTSPKHTMQDHDGQQKCKRVFVREMWWRVVACGWARGHRVRWRCG